MAAPRLRLRRGTTTPVGNVTTALSGEPFFDTSASNLYVASGASTFVHVGGTSYTARVDESLTAATATTSGEVTILARTDVSGGGSVTFDVADIATDSVYTWPAAPASSKILQTDSNGNLSWVDQASGYSGWTVSDGSNSENIASTDTVTFTGGSGISQTYATATNVLTTALDINELTALDAEGGTDPLVVADSFAVYDASATANKKVTISNLETVIFADVSGDITIAANGTAAIGSGVIVDGDISATAEIAVSKLANGTARQLLQTDAAGTGVEWATNIDVPGTLDVTGDGTFDSNVTITGNLTVNGTTTTLSTTNTVIEDRLLELANGTTGTPTADAGIVIERGDLDNIFIGYDEGLDIFVTGTTTAVGTATDVSPTPIAVLCGALHVTDTAGTNEAIVSYLAAGSAPDGATAGRYLQNLTIDAGTY